MLVFFLSFVAQLISVVAQCPLDGQYAEAVNKFPCLLDSTLSACQNRYDPVKVDNKRSDCNVVPLEEAYERVVECSNSCGNDGPCQEACGRQFDAEAAIISARCDAIYEEDLAQAKCEAYDCYQSLSCDPAPGTPEPDPESIPNPEPEVPVPVPNPGNPSTPPPLQCQARDYHSNTCSVDTNAACLSPKSGTKLVQKPIGAPNGCGPVGNGYRLYLTEFLAVAVPLFREACNTHDNCFGTCSFGDDAQFEICNANILTSSLKICYDNYQILGNHFRLCVVEAQAVFAAIQEAGCSAYNSAQQGACKCVPCDNTPMATNQVTLDLLSAVQSICAGVVSSIANAWPTFVRAIDTAAQSATDVDRAALRFYAGRIGASSPVTSPQIAELSASCGQGSRRKRNHDYRSLSIGKDRRAEVSLSSFFAGLVSTDARTYACGPNDSQGVCQTALDLLEIARLSRQIDSYSGNPSSSVLSSSSSSIGGTSSTSQASNSDPVTSPSASVIMTDVTSSGGSSSSATSAASPLSTTTPSTTPESTILPSSDSHSTLTETQSSSGGVSAVSSEHPGEASTKEIDATSTPSPDTIPTPSMSAAACTLVKIYGDSPDTPDSPDGQPELPEIPDYPGGYYYLCQDGSTPSRSLLPPPYGPASTPMSTSTVSVPRAGEAVASPGVGSCVWTKVYGDSPDTPDTPDSPDEQPETPEIPETPQDGGFYWQCI